MKEIDFQYDLLPLKNKLYRLALRITLDTNEAEDITQETLIRVWTKRASLIEISSIEAYCMTICKNLSLDRQESKAAQNTSLDDNFVEPIDNTLQPDEELEQKEKITRVRTLFNMLPTKQRIALQLREIEEKNYKEIAEIMGITEDNVKILIHRARMTIRKNYDKIDQYGL